MSVGQRRLARLPLGVYDKLRNDDDDAESLRSAVCAKLQSFPKKARNGTVNYESVQTVGALLQYSTLAILRVLDPLFTYEECDEFLRRVSEHCAPKSASAYNLLVGETSKTEAPHSHWQRVEEHLQQHRHRRRRQQPFLPTCISPQWDNGSAFRVGMLTELVGKAGTGKTQLVMQLCVVAARYGIGSIFVDTEKKLSLQRLKEIASQRQRSTTQQQSFGATDPNAAFLFYSNPTQRAAMTAQTQTQPQGALDYRPSDQVLANVSVHSPTSTEELVSVLQSLDDEILLRNNDAENQQQSTHFPVGLLVLDSIAAPARRDFGSGSAPQRAAAMVQCAQLLKRLADQHSLAVVVINQIGGHESGALGMTWHHCVSTRILMEQQQDGASQRTATIVKSNTVGCGVPIPFSISSLGVVADTPPRNPSSNSD